MVEIRELKKTYVKCFHTFDVSYANKQDYAGALF
jgi:hypothetical protein